MLSEDEIHRTVVRHLEQRAPPDVMWFHPANGERRTKLTGARLKGLGVVAGVPDLFLFRSGHSFALELKRDDGALSVPQEDVIARLKMAGVSVAVAYGLDAALAQLEEWRIFSRACSERSRELAPPAAPRGRDTGRDGQSALPP